MVSSNSPKKRTKEFVFTTTRNSFVRFLGEFEDTKKSFWNYLTFKLLQMHWIIILFFIFRYLNDVLIENNERFQVSCKEAEYLYRLDIEGCCEDDYGKVKVVAKNENGESEKEVCN